MDGDRARLFGRAGGNGLPSRQQPPGQQQPPRQQPPRQQQPPRAAAAPPYNPPQQQQGGYGSGPGIGYGNNPRGGGYPNQPNYAQQPRSAERPPAFDDGSYKEYSDYTPQAPRSNSSQPLRYHPFYHAAVDSGTEGRRLILDNVCAISSRLFPQQRNGDDYYIMIRSPGKGDFVVMGRPFAGSPFDNNTQVIALSDKQREWLDIGVKTPFSVDIYDPFQQGRKEDVYLGAVTFEIDFAPGKKRPDQKFNEDDIVKEIRTTLNKQILAPRQPVILEVNAVPLLLVVSTIEPIIHSLENTSSMAPLNDPQSRGVVVDTTEFLLFKKAGSTLKIKGSSKRAAANAIIAPDFKFESMGIGGLDDEFSIIFRRAFASRIFPPGLVEKLGLPHVKGMLLYGPPGTGKTLIARQIGKMLNAREPKIINGPEVLNKYVGQSEENIRKMFGDAEKEYKEKGDESDLHIIIFDELDAVCKQRGTTSGGTGVGDSVVNQLLSKLDGVNQLNNILLIGMTNRKDMIDDALLRPGRLEVQIEIGLPDEHGRSQILTIHTSKLKENNILENDVDIVKLAELTKNFSGAELAGLVRSASSFAMNRHVKVDSFAALKDDVEELKVCQADFMKALDEVKPAFGAPEDELGDVGEHGIIHYSTTVQDIVSRAQKYFKADARTRRVQNLLIYGDPKAGITALAAHMASQSGYPFVKLITTTKLTNMRDEYAKCDYINKCFADAYKSPQSVIILDNIQDLAEYVPLGPRFSNIILQTLRGKMVGVPPKEHRLLIISTSSNQGLMEQLGLRNLFDALIPVPMVRDLQQLEYILQEAQPFSNDQEISDAIEEIRRQNNGSDEVNLGVKLLLEEAFVAQAANGRTRAKDFADAIVHEMEDKKMRYRY